jgi:hypothetical protein
MRLRRAFDLGAGVDSIAAVLAMHPALRPRSYVDVAVDDGDGGATIVLRPCAATEETLVGGWIARLVSGDAAALDAIVGAIDPRARCEPIATPRGALRAWRVAVGPDPLPEPREVTLTRFSTGADFEFALR